jgi:hypothetical protein
MAKTTCTPINGIDHCVCGWTYWDSEDKGKTFICGSCGKPFQPSLFPDEPSWWASASLSAETVKRVNDSGNGFTPDDAPDDSQVAALTHAAVASAIRDLQNDPDYEPVITASPAEVNAHEHAAAIAAAEARLAELDDARDRAYRAAERAEGAYLDQYNALVTLRRNGR